jgi:hypothetical protein
MKEPSCSFGGGKRSTNTRSRQKLNLFNRHLLKIFRVCGHFDGWRTIAGVCRAVANFAFSLIAEFLLWHVDLDSVKTADGNDHCADVVWDDWATVMVWLLTQLV